MYGNISKGPVQEPLPLAVETAIKSEGKKPLSPENGSLCVFSYESPETIPPGFGYEDVESSCGVLAENILQSDNSHTIARFTGEYVGTALYKFGKHRKIPEESKKAQESANRICGHMVERGLLDEAGAFAFVLGAANATGELRLAYEFLQKRRNGFAEPLRQYLNYLDKKVEGKKGAFTEAEKELAEMVEAIKEGRGVEKELEWIKKYYLKRRNP